MALLVHKPIFGGGLLLGRQFQKTVGPQTNAAIRANLVQKLDKIPEASKNRAVQEFWAIYVIKSSQLVHAKNLPKTALIVRRRVIRTDM